MAKRSNKLCECECGKFTDIAEKTDKRRGHVKGEAMRFLPGHASNNGKARGAGLSLILDKSPAELDELKIRGTRSLGDAEAAKILDERLRFMETQYKRNFVERGLILVEMEERKLYQHLTDPDTGKPYDTFERWVVTAATHSRSDCFEAMRAVKELRDIPKEQLMGIPRKNIKVLQGLSPKVRKQSSVIKAAQTDSKNEFIRKIQAEHPDQHVEQESKVTTHPTVSQREVIDLARSIATWVYGSAGRESADEAIANFFLEGDCEREGYSQLTNRRAYETAKVRGEIV